MKNHNGSRTHSAKKLTIHATSPQEPKSLSEQQYLDCVYEGKRDGCNGGWPTDCYAWTRDNGNFMALEKEYPYTEIGVSSDLSWF